LMPLDFLLMGNGGVLNLFVIAFEFKIPDPAVVGFPAIFQPFGETVLLAGEFFAFEAEIDAVLPDALMHPAGLEQAPLLPATPARSRCQIFQQCCKLFVTLENRVHFDKASRVP